MQDKDKVIDAILRLVEELGETPSQRRYKELCKDGARPDLPGWKRVKRLFGGWNDMLREANLLIKREMSKMDDRRILKIIEAFVIEHGRVPTESDYANRIVGVDIETVYAHFGSLTAALAELGLRSNYGRGADFMTIYVELRRMAEKLGRVPTREEFEASYGFVVYRKNRSWPNIVESAGLKHVRKYARDAKTGRFVKKS
jgi:hypothetical protein